MTNIALFDFDGVIADTEPIYDVYWNEAGIRYGLGIENFATQIKGTTMPSIMQTYFSKFPADFQAKVIEESEAFEQQMDFPLVEGVMEFIESLKAAGMQVGLVTSSDNKKLKRAFEMLQLDGVFDTVVTADRITSGKPDPMCYRLAASDLGATPDQCVVFEDSFAGIKSGTAAEMRVIGLSTSNPESALQDKVYKVIPDFSAVTIEELFR